MDRRSQVDLSRPLAQSLARFPRLADAVGEAVEVLLLLGDCLFIPPYTWHEIDTLDDDNVSVSIFFDVPADDADGSASEGRSKSVSSAVLVGVGRSICTAVHEALDQAALKEEAVKEVCRPCDVKRCMQLLLETAMQGAAQQEQEQQQQQQALQPQQHGQRGPSSLHREAACVAASASVAASILPALAQLLAPEKLGRLLRSLYEQAKAI
eukprot:g2236.t1